MLPMQWELVEEGGDADAVGVECGTSFQEVRTIVGLELPMSTNRDGINDESTLKAINANGLFNRPLLSKTHLHHVSMY